MKKLQEIDLLVEEAINLLDFKDTNCWREILTTLARKCAEINDNDLVFCCSGSMNNYNSRLRDGQVEEVKQEEVKEQTKPPLSKYYSLFKYFLDEHNVMLLETDCQEIERLLNTQQSNLQPLPKALPDFMLHYNRSELSSLQLWEKIRQHFGTQPREWWMDLKKGDKFVFNNGAIREVKTFNGIIDKSSIKVYLGNEESEVRFVIDYCSPYTDPAQSFRSKLTPEMQVEFDKVVSSLTPNTPQL